MSRSATIIAKLASRNIQLILAESCTGGLISSSIVKNSGASSNFLGSLVVYSNELKIRLLGVKHATLVHFSPYSEEVVREMLEGALNISNQANLAMAISGAAEEIRGVAPAGLVFIGIAFKGNKTLIEVTKWRFAGSRSEIINSAKDTALKLLDKFLDSIDARDT